MKSDTIGRFVTEHAKATVAIVLVLTLVLAYFATEAQMETDYKSFMPDDEASRAYNEIMDDYYSTEIVQVLIKYNDSNAVSKQALIEELLFESDIVNDSDIVDHLQTPGDPSRSIYSVADMVISLDMMSKSMISTMNSTIQMVPALEQLNSSMDGIQGSVSYYLYQYSQDPEGENTTAALDTAYMVLSKFLEIGGGFEPPSPPSGMPSMTIDQKIAYLNNMSDEEIHNILAYGIPISPLEMQNLAMKFMQANRQVQVLSDDISQKSSNLSASIGSALLTEPVRSNMTINATFSASYMAFSGMEHSFTELSAAMENMMEMMDPQMLDTMKEMLHSMISSDFSPETASASATLMVINLNGTSSMLGDDGENANNMLAVHMEIRQIADSFQGKGDYSAMSVRLMDEDMGSSMDQTFRVLLPIAFLLVIIILLLVFRNLLDTILGLIGLAMAIIWTYGLGVLLNLEFNVITTTVAILIVGLGIDYAIHTIMRYREELAAGKDVTSSIKAMERNLGMALILATTTTMLSFLSNLSSPIPPIRDYGIMNAVGIFSAFILFITFVPAVKVILDGRKEAKGKKLLSTSRTDSSGSSRGPRAIDRFLAMGSIGAERHPWKVLIVVLIISLASMYGAMNLGTDFSETDFLPQDTESYQIMNYISTNFNTSGMEESYVLIKGDVESPQLLKAIDEAAKNMDNDTYLSTLNAQNIVYLIRSEASRDSNFSALVNSLDTDGDGLPDSNVGEVYDYLYAHSEKTQYVLCMKNGTYVSTLMRVKPTSETSSQDSIMYDQLKQDIKPIKELGYYAVITGGSVMSYIITSSLQRSQWNSLILTIVFSLIILTLVFWYERRAPILGLITTLPVVIALLWSMGIMYLIGMNFDMMTVSITALTIGLGITYSIHLTHRFTEELEEKKPEEAMRSTVLNTGSAIFGAAATTIGGFGVLMLSDMPPMRDFGLIATLSILLSFLLSVFVLPTFLVMWARRRNGKEENSDNSEDDDSE